MDSFFVRVLEYERNPLTDGLLGLIGMSFLTNVCNVTSNYRSFRFLESKSDAFMNFGEFVELVCTFCFFEQLELLRYMFYILDPQKTGLVEKHELKHFFLTIWKQRPYGNVQEAMDHLHKLDEDGTYNFRELSELRTKYPHVFYPLYELQISMISHTLGEAWWENQKAKVAEEREIQRKREMALLKRKKKEKDKAMISVNDELVKKRMGIKFYLMPWMRNTERKRIAKIAAIENDLEEQFTEMKRKLDK